jgi:nucleoid-associated protein YgaU
MGIFGRDDRSGPARPDKTPDPTETPAKKDRTADFSNVVSGGSSTAPPAASERPPEARPERTYTVRPGDSLWKIAKRQYGDGNDWSRLYEANRETIGANPDLIHPGQVLVIPEP